MMRKNRSQFLSQFSEKTMGYKWVKLPKMGCFVSFELNTPSDRVFSVLSDGERIIGIGQTEQKLWPFKDSALQS